MGKWKSLLETWSSEVKKGCSPPDALACAAAGCSASVECTSSKKVRRVKSGGDEIVVKWWGCGEYHVHEACHLEWLQSHAEAARAPRLEWQREPVPPPGGKKWFLFAMESVPGQRLDERLNEPGCDAVGLLDIAVDRLANIHGLINSPPPCLRKVYFGCTLTKRLAGDLRKVVCALPAHKSSLSENLQRIDTEAIAVELSKPAQVVLGHGDYKPNNLMVVREGSDLVVRPIDWVDMGQATPWYDLAYLLKGQTKDQTKALTKTYVKKVQAAGMLPCLTEAQAHSGLEWARVAQLITSTGSGDPSKRRDLTKRCCDICVAWDTRPSRSE